PDTPCNTSCQGATAPPPPRPAASTEKLRQAFTASSRDELPVANSFDRQQLVGDRADASGRAPERDDLEAGVLIEVDVQARRDRAIPVMLDVRELVGERARLVVVDEGQHTDRLARQGRPFLLHELAAEQIAPDLAAAAG